MEEMLKKAVECLREYPELNEIELTDATGIKVRIIRNPPFISFWNSGTSWWLPISNAQPWKITSIKP